MNRRFFLKAAAALPAAGVLGGVPRLSLGATPGQRGAGQWRVFEVTTIAEILKPSGATRVWLPLPLTEDTDYQKNLGSTWVAESASVTTSVDKEYGAGIAFAEWPEAVGTPRVVVTSRFATRDRAIDLKGARRTERTERAMLARYTEATDLIPTDGIVRNTAGAITKGARGDIEKARAIYEWVVDKTFRNPKTRGCGVGDIKFMLETGNLGGKCADLNALFVGLARSVGIPARDVYGVRVADSSLGYKSLGKSGDITKAQHCRAEFYAAGYGWVPVDPADVRKVVLEERPGLALNDEVVKAARERLFGSWEMNWLAFNYAHDVQLPRASRGKIAFFMYPQCETAEGRLDSLDPDNFRYQMTAREMAV